MPYAGNPYDWNRDDAGEAIALEQAGVDVVVGFWL